MPDGRKLIRYCVLASPLPKTECNRNIYCLDTQGKVLWRVADHEARFSADGGDPFIGIRVHGDGSIVGTTWEGWVCQINPNDGSLAISQYRIKT